MRILKTKASLSKKMIWMEIPASLCSCIEIDFLFMRSLKTKAILLKKRMVIDGDTASLLYYLSTA